MQMYEQVIFLKEKSPDTLVKGDRIRVTYVKIILLEQYSWMSLRLPGLLSLLLVKRLGQTR